jgi:hypothetical protein
MNEVDVSQVSIKTLMFERFVTSVVKICCTLWVLIKRGSTVLPNLCMLLQLVCGGGEAW